MSTIVAAVVVGLLLLWGGIAGLLRLVELFERRHVLALGAYATLVTGLVIGLVLFEAHQRQKEHRRDLQEEMDAVARRLSELSDRLVSQLAEKADLTASEFEIRARLQTEQAHHARALEDLAGQRRRTAELDSGLARERQANQAYQEEVNRKLEARSTAEDERYRSIRDLLEAEQRTVQGIQKQLAGVQEEEVRANARAVEIATAQSNLLGKVGAAAQVGDNNAQKIDALARSHAALYDDLRRAMAQVDSLYTWKKQ